METTNQLIVPKQFTIGNLEINANNLKVQMAEDTKHIIKNVNDIAGYKAAIAFRASYRTVRTTLEKVRKEMSKPHQDYIKRLKEITDELGAIALGGEEYFDNIITEIDNEKLRLKEVERLAKQKVLSSRIASLSAIGATFDGETYSYAYTPDNVLRGAELNDFTDQEFEEYLSFAQGAWDEEQKRLEDKRLADELEVETQRKLIESNEATAKANAEKQYKLRVKELTLSGYFWNESDQLFMSKSCPSTLTIDEITNEFNDEEWEVLMYHIDNYVAPKPVEVAKLTPVTEQAYEGATEVNLPPDYKPFSNIHTIDGYGNINPVIKAKETFNDTGLVFKEVVHEERDYSLNDFENLTKVSFNGTKKEKQTILDAIADYKKAIDNF